MPRFFVDYISGDTFTIDGENARHISRSLRMKKGEIITLSDGDGTDFGCEIIDFSDENVTVKILYSQPCENEPTVKVHLYQGVPKGDKLEEIIQKCVELGVSEITPVVTSRSVSRPDKKSGAKKIVRYEKIALEAAKQSGRGIVVKVNEFVPFNQVLPLAAEDLIIAFYECGGKSLTEIISEKCNVKSIGIFIGPEGGFEKGEIDALCGVGAVAATLGKRILRTQTAPVAAMSCIMLLTGNLD